MSILIIIGIILGILILITVLAGIIRILRSGSFKIIKPEGSIRGKVMIVYDPGLSGGTKTASFYMAEELKSKGYEVKVTGIRSKEALETSGYDFLVVGSPTYGAKPTLPIKSYLNGLIPTKNIIAGVYALAGGDTQDANVVMAQTLKQKSIPVKVSTKFGGTIFGAGNKNKYSGFVSDLLR